MSEIEKMYKNAGVEPYRLRNNCVDDNGNRITNSKNCPLRSVYCNTCDKPYYEFTAEKQIKLIKWLVRHRFNFMVYELKDNDFTFEVINKRLKQTSQFVSLSENNFEEGLAKVLDCFWQDLTEEEKQQVKGILE